MAIALEDGTDLLLEDGAAALLLESDAPDAFTWQQLPTCPDMRPRTAPEVVAY